MLMQAHGLQSVLSTPAIGSDGLAHGAISTSFRGAIDLTEAQRSAIAEAASLCAQLARYSRSREARELLLGELDHRIRNLFSSVGAVANLTLRGHPDPLDFQRVLGSRLVIMARAHALAVSPVETSLDVLLSEALAPYSSDFQIRCVGPDITLAKEAAAALALTIHELATNARKYGALSTTGGNIEVLWSIALSPDDGGGEVFNLSWSESGGPAVSPPSKRGFGSRTVSSSVRSAFDGSAEVQYLPAGIVCNISAPLSSRFGYLSGVAA
ncbi:Chemotaxis protein methyltransferase CheR [plant metagenome]